MAAKRLLNFLLLKPAFSARNLTSLALVGVFFGVYYLAGGNVRAVPKLDSGATFGSIKTQEDTAPVARQSEDSAIFEALREDTRKDAGTKVPNTLENKDDELSDLEQRLNRLPARRSE